MTLHLHLSQNQSATVINAYAQTLDSNEEVKKRFYSDLDNTLASIPRDKVILLGDFNTRVGCDHKIWSKNGMRKANADGILLLTKCTQHGLILTDTVFHQKDWFKTTWKHLRLEHWHLLNYIIIQGRDLRDVLVMRAMKGSEDCWTDHRLVHSVMNIHLVSRHWKTQKAAWRWLNITALKDPGQREKVQAQLHSALEQVPTDDDISIQAHWEQLKSAVQDACAQTIGFALRWNQDWFNANDAQIRDLLKWKHAALKLPGKAIHKVKDGSVPPVEG
ncbi:hypothetical protein Y1Q_0019866 [Alligator mississippiensis]|uniref:Endonuclease/exonuclease/phosphatase domain-containing protein n=1 Tax=Alligator mississippiensis TaxID=8496 RepID=A0A151PFN4_ALLMI|nr:hypothetical protein Y1Q_0019866 [Alligator mississippiensis]